MGSICNISDVNPANLTPSKAFIVGKVQEEMSVSASTSHLVTLIFFPDHRGYTTGFKLLPLSEPRCPLKLVFSQRRKAKGLAASEERSPWPSGDTPKARKVCNMSKLGGTHPFVAVSLCLRASKLGRGPYLMLRKWPSIPEGKPLTSFGPSGTCASENTRIRYTAPSNNHGRQTGRVARLPEYATGSV